MSHSNPHDAHTTYLVIYADGSVKALRAGAGIVVCDGRSHIIAIANQTLPSMSNNEAEYTGLMMALEFAFKLNAARLEIRLDSEIVVMQMTGRAAVNSPRLRILHRRACHLATQFERVSYRRIPRRKNVIADALAAEASAGRSWNSLFLGGS